MSMPALRRTRIPVPPTTWGWIFMLAKKPIIHSRPQTPSTSTTQRAGRHGTTLLTMRSKIGISTIDRPMKTPRIGLTTPM
jgi:hypothetical protein